MSLVGFCLRNILNDKARASTLGLFVAVIAFLVVLAGAFASSTRERIQSLLVEGMTGHLQFRPADNPERDMFGMAGNWESGGKYFLEAPTIDAIRDIASARYSGSTLYPRVRLNALLVSDADKDLVMVMGVDCGDPHVLGSFVVGEGRMLRPGDDHAIVLPKRIAERLGVRVGDSVGAIGVSGGGYTVDAGLTVVGIGMNALTAQFDYGIDLSYLDLAAARELTGLADGEATDAMLFLPRIDEAPRAARTLGAELDRSLPPADGVRTTSFETMGGFMMMLLTLYDFVFAFFIAVIVLIAAIITSNLILMMGLERRQEIGTMRAIGYSRHAIVALFVGEILLVSTVFGAVGAGAGLGIVKWLSEIVLRVDRPLSYATGADFSLMFRASYAAPVALVVPLFAILSALYPSLRASRERPAEALRDQ